MFSPLLWKRMVNDEKDRGRNQGVEEYEQELLAFRKMYDGERTKKVEERITKRAREVKVETGIVNSSVVQEIWTYQEIEHAVVSQDGYIGSLASRAEVVMAELMQAQVRATLLLAAQSQRIADALETQNERSEVGTYDDLMTRLYKVE